MGWDTRVGIIAAFFVLLDAALRVRASSAPPPLPRSRFLTYGRFLLSAGAAVSARTEKRLTALHIACESGFTDTAR